MKRFFTFLFVSTFALLAFVSCKDKDVPYVQNEPGVEYDEAYYASHATVSSSDSQFTSTGEGGTISFKSAGGSVVVNVDCGTEWTAQNNASDMFGCSMQATSITVTAEQNLLEEELTGSIILMTVPSGIQFATLTLTQNAYGAPEITVSANTWNVPAVGEVMTTEIEVDATDDWTISNEASWLTAEKGGTGLILTAAENAETTARTAAVVLTCSDEFNSDTATITVTQDGLAYITLSEKELEFGAAGGEAAVTVESNFEWSYTYESDWYTIVENTDGSLTVTCAANETLNDRTGSVAFAAGDGALNVTEATLTITQGVAEAYITLSTTQLSFDGNENETAVTVESNFDWEYATEASWITLTKATDGTALTVKVAENDSDANREGTVTVTAGTGTNTAEAQITVIQAYLETDSALILTYTTPSANTVVVLPLYGTVNCTVNWGDGVIETVTTSNPSHTYAAAGDYEVKVEGTVTQLYSNNIDQSSLDCLTSVTSWGDMEFTSMDYAFYKCSNLKSLPEVTGNAMLNVTSFAHAFHSCTSLETVPTDLTMNCSKLTTVQYIFDGCTSLKNGPSFAGCSALTTASYIFYECSSLTTTPEGMLSGCTKVTTLAYLFYKCTLLTDDNVRAGMFDDCTAVTTFLGAFWNCSSLTKIPDKLFDNNTKVTNFSYTFYGCSGLTSIPAGLFDYAPGVTTFLDVFYNCSGLTSIPDGMFDYNTEVTTFGSAFYKCSAITTVPTGLFDHNLKVTTFSYTFYGCSSVSGESPYILLSDGTTKVHLYDRADYLSELGCVEPTTTGNCFSSSTFSDINSIPSSWGGKGN